MELEGLQRCMQKLGDVNITSITTDRHKQINSYLRQSYLNISHQFDLWYIGKIM